MMIFNRGIGLAMGVSVFCFAGAAAAQENLDQGKTPAQLFASDCAICHKSPQGLAKSGGIGACVPSLRVDESERRCDAYVEGSGGHGDRDEGKRERSCLLSRKRDARDADRHAISPPLSKSKSRATNARGLLKKARRNGPKAA